MKKIITLLLSIICYLQVSAVLNVPSLLSPANGSTNNAPNEILDWGTSTGATAYQYKLGTIASLAGVNAQTITGSSQVTTSNLLFGTVYYWQVRAIKTTAPTDSSDWSAIFNFTTIDFIFLVAPTNGAISQAPNEVIDWSALSGITFYDYQWDTSATFNSPLNNYNSIATGTSQATTSNLRFGTKYYWRVRARHTADTSQWSSVFNFTTVDLIFLVATTNGALSQAPNEIIDWSALGGIMFYDYQWDTSATFNSPLSNYNSIAAGTSQITTSNLRFGTKYYWRVRARHTADTSQWSSVFNFTTVDLIFLVATTNGALSQAPNEIIDWSALGGITFYDYQWDTSATFNSPLSNYNSIAAGTSQITTSNLRFGTKYYWRVRARHTADTSQWSFVSNFTTVDFIFLVSPTNGAINLAPNEVIDWSALSGITFYDYQWDTSATFNSPLNNYNSIAAGTSQITTSNLRFGTKYYWRVRARHTADTTQWSFVSNFTTIDFVVHVSPANNSVGLSLNPIIDWSPISGIIGYQYRYSTNSNFSNPSLFTPIGTTSQATLSNLSYGYDYFWQVRAYHAVDTTEWTLPWTFTTIYQIIAAPFLSVPSNTLTGIPTTGTTLQWTSVTTATSYQYQLDDNSSFTSPLSNSVTTLTASTGTLIAGTTYYWRVRASNGSGNSPWSVVWSFITETPTLAAPTLISPADNSTEIVLTGTTSQWSAVNTATSYEYQLDDNASFTSPLSNSVTTLTASTGTLIAGTTYYWRVRAINGTGNSPWSVVWSFITETPTLAAPTLINPGNNSTGVLLVGTTLQWSSVNTATSYEYQLDDNSSFTSPLSNSVTTLTAPTGTLIAGTTYYWRVRAINGTGNSPWSVVWSFITEIPTLAAPTLISPADNSTGVLVAGTTLQWNSVTTAISYEYQLDDNSSFTSPLSNSVTTLTASTGTLIAGTTYYWRVRAGNGAGFSPWSTVWSFTTDIVTSLNTEQLENILTVYPNPSNGNFNFKIESANLITDYKVKICNLNGQVIKQFLNSNAAFLIDLTEFPNGIYFVKLISEKEIFTKRIVKY